MKIIDIVVEGTDISLDFSGFAGKECESEEARLRLLLAKAGVTTRSETEEEKGEPNEHVEAEKVTN